MTTTASAEHSGADRGFVSVAPRLGFVAGFDGIRGIFVMCVILEHIFPGNFESFAVVLDVFFVMSAFLIVTLLMQEHRDNNTVSLKKFYQRRAVRLLPSAYLHMLVWILLGAVLTLSGTRIEGHNVLTEVLKDVAAAFTYTYHIFFPVGLAAIDSSEGFRPMGHFWSLSVEEQFYLVVAITMVVCLKRNWVRPLAAICIAVAVWIGWSRYHMDLGPWPGREISSSVWTRGLQLMWIQRPDALLLGVVLAVLNAHLPDDFTERWRKFILPIGWVAGGLLGFSLLWSAKAFHEAGWPFYLQNLPEQLRSSADGLECAVKGEAFRPCTDTMWFPRVGHNLTAISIAPVVFCLARYKTWFPNRFLGWSPFRYLGRLSYALYIWHVLAIILVHGAVEDASKPVKLVVSLAAVFAVSLPVYYFVEQRALRRKLRYAAEKEVLDLRTGEMVNVDDAIAASSGPGAARTRRFRTRRPPT